MNNSQTTIFFIKCTQIAYACLMLLTVSCAKINSQYGVKRNHCQNPQSEYNPKQIKITFEKEKHLLLTYLKDNHIKKFKELLSELPAFFDINFTDNNGLTLLHHASSLGRKDFVELLLENCANVMAIDTSGLTPFWYAKNKAITMQNTVIALDNESCNSIIAMIKDKYRNIQLDKDKLIKAIIEDKLDQVNNSLYNNCYINCPIDDNGTTILMLAITYGNLDAFKKLLMVKNIDINACDRKGNNASYYAKKYGRHTMKDSLLRDKRKNTYPYNEKKSSLELNDSKLQSLREAIQYKNYDKIEEELKKMGTDVIRTFAQ